MPCLAAGAFLGRSFLVQWQVQQQRLAVSKSTEPIWVVCKALVNLHVDILVILFLLQNVPQPTRTSTAREPKSSPIFMNPATGQPNRVAEKSEQVLFRYCSSNIGRMDSGVRFESMGIKEIEIQSC
jgi:hypothetical protein